MSNSNEKKEMSLETKLELVSAKEAEAIEFLGKVEAVKAAGIDLESIGLTSENFSSPAVAEGFLAHLKSLRDEEATKEEIAEKLHRNTWNRGRKARSPLEAFKAEKAKRIEKYLDKFHENFLELYAATTIEIGENFVEHDLSISNSDGEPHTKRCKATRCGGKLFEVQEEIASMDSSEYWNLVVDFFGTIADQDSDEENAEESEEN